MIKHIRRWNIWRKGCLNGPVHKVLVLFGLRKSPTFELMKVCSELEVDEDEQVSCVRF